MDALLTGPVRPQFRSRVEIRIDDEEAHLAIGTHECAFGFAREDRPAVAAFLDCLRRDGADGAELARAVPLLAERIPGLLQDFDRLRLIQESDRAAPHARTGAQLYREVRRAADRAVA